MTTLSIIGLYNYDNTIFDPITLPEGMELETLKNNILMECGTLETYIPDPTIMKNAIGYWSATHQAIWQHLYETTQYEYNPIWNKDGTIIDTETRNLAAGHTDTETRNLASGSSTTETRNLTGSEDTTETRNLTGSDDTTETRNLAGTEDSTTTHSTSAYDSASTFTNRDKTELDKDTSDTGSVTTEKDTTEGGTITTEKDTTDGGTVSVTGTGSDTGTVSRHYTASDTGTVTHRRTEQGNIGITTTQQMIKEEREIALFNVYTYITESFKERFCILVY